MSNAENKPAGKSETKPVAKEVTEPAGQTETKPVDKAEGKRPGRRRTDRQARGQNVVHSRRSNTRRIMRLSTGARSHPRDPSGKDWAGFLSLAPSPPQFRRHETIGCYSCDWANVAVESRGERCRLPRVGRCSSSLDSLTFLAPVQAVLTLAIRSRVAVPGNLTMTSDKSVMHLTRYPFVYVVPPR